MESKDYKWESILLSIRRYASHSKDAEPQKIKNVVSGSILTYRAHHKLTQEELSRRLGVTRLQIARWEAAKNKPNQWAIKLLKEHGVINKEV